MGEGSPAGLNPPMGSPHRGWMLHQKIIGVVRRMKGSDGQYLWRPAFAGLQYADPQTVSGYPIVMNNHMSSALTTGLKLVAFGNFGYFMARTAGVKINARFFDSGTAGSYSVQFIAFIRCGGRFVGGLKETNANTCEAVKMLKLM